MSGRIDEPRGIEGETVAKNDCDKVGVPERLPPEIPRHHGRHHETEGNDGGDVILSLVEDHRVGQDVGHVDLALVKNRCYLYVIGLLDL